MIIITIDDDLNPAGMNFNVYQSATNDLGNVQPVKELSWGNGHQHTKPIKHSLDISLRKSNPT
jgi:hypothetical protein